MVKKKRSRHKRSFLKVKPLRSPMAWALLCSTSLHLLFFGLFSVQKIDTGTSWIHLPVMADSDTSDDTQSLENDAILIADHHGLLPRFVDQPDSQMPTMQSSLLMTPYAGVLPLSRPQNEIIPLSSLEKRRFSGHFKESSFDFLPSQALFEISFSGDLSDYIIHNEKELVHLIPKNIQTAPGHYLVSFNIQIENKTGDIFWSEQCSSSESAELDDIAMNIVHAVKLKSEKNLGLPKGKMEISFNIP